MTFKKSYPELKPAHQDPPPEMPEETPVKKGIDKDLEEWESIYSTLSRLPKKDRPHLSCLTPLVDMLRSKEDDDNEDPKK